LLDQALLTSHGPLAFTFIRKQSSPLDMRPFMRKSAPLIGLGLLALIASTGLAADKKYNLATVVKISGIN